MMGPESGGSSPAFSVLFVCTGNAHRSVLAEFLLRSRLDNLGLRWSVTSAGTRARDGLGVDVRTRTVLDEVGLDASLFHSRRLTADDAAAADLVLTAEAEHRAAVLTAQPRALGRTFTIRQFARYADAVLPTDLAEPTAEGWLAAVAAARSRVQPGAAGSDDIADIQRGRLRQFRATRDVIDASLATMLAPLTRE